MAAVATARGDGVGSKDLGEGFFLDGGLGKVLDRAKLARGHSSIGAFATAH